MLALVMESGYDLGYAPSTVAEDDQSASLRQAMERYVGGDVAAFHTLYRSISPRLLGYLAGLLGDRAAAEDALQQTFIRLHEARGSYVQGADPAPWIFTIGHRLALDELRRRKRTRVRLAGAEEHLPELRADLDGSKEGTAEVPDERIEVTLALVQQLPEAQRAAIMLTKVEGRSLAEAAAITGSTVSAIKLRAHRAYVTLRKLMKKAAS